MNYLLVFLACVFTFSFAQTSSFAETTIITKALQPALLEFRTDPKLTGRGEMRLIIYRTDDDARTFDTRVVPPVEPGRYRLEYPFPAQGSWEIRVRFGTGLALYETWISIYLEPDSDQTQTFRNAFYSSMSADTPRYIQPLGFGIFALVLVVALTLVTTILRWLKRQQPMTQPTAHNKKM